MLFPIRNTKLLWLVLMQAIVLYNKAQNLVSNGYFEIHNDCQSGAISNAIGWNASSETPNYYNACWPHTSGSNVPYAALGYQQDCCGGEGYAGGFMFDKNSSNNSDRDYINTKLIDTLKAGHKYIAKMYVSRGEAVDYAVATIGMLLTDTITNLPYGQGFISANPQVKSTILLADTLNWMVVQDTFIAVGGETYLTIGNFNTDLTSDTVKLTNYWPSFPIAYYYIDGVSVYDVATLGIEQFTGNSKQVTVYPNPATNMMQVTYTGNIGQVSLYDVFGNEVISTKEKEIDVSSLPNGIYFLNVKTTEGVLSKKVVVQH